APFVDAPTALSPSANGFTASDLAARVRLFSEQDPLPYGPRNAAYDLKKLRGKQIVQRIARTRRYHTLPAGLRAMAALLVLRNKAIKPLLAACWRRCRSRQRRAEQDVGTASSAPRRTPETAPPGRHTVRGARRCRCGSRKAVMVGSGPSYRTPLRHSKGSARRRDPRANSPAYSRLYAKARASASRPGGKRR